MGFLLHAVPVTHLSPVLFPYPVLSYSPLSPPLPQIETDRGSAFLTQLDFLNYYVTNQGAVQVTYPNLWVRTPDVVNRDGSVTNGTYIFNCPVPCDSYTCSDCAALFGRPCRIYVRAGDDISMTVQAVNIFGRAQTVTRDDNFTVIIQGNGFADDNNPNLMPVGGIKLGPVFRATNDGFGTLTTGGLVPPTTVPPTPPPSLEDPDLLAWDYPNYHNPGAFPRPDGQALSWNWTISGTGSPLRLNETFDQRCNTTTYPEFAIDGKCFRYLVRPRVFGNGGGQYIFNFGLDKAGQYMMRLTLRGDSTYTDDLSFDLGAELKASPFTLQVLPGAPDNRTTRASGPGTVAATVGDLATFTIYCYDRFGNPNVDGGATLSVTLKSKDYTTVSWEAPLS